MSAVQPAPAVDQGKLNEFLVPRRRGPRRHAVRGHGRHRRPLGLYRRSTGGRNAGELSSHTGCAERYLRDGSTTRPTAGTSGRRGTAATRWPWSRRWCGRSRQPGVPARRLPGGARGGDGRAADRRGAQPARAWPGASMRRRGRGPGALLQPTSRQPRRVVAARARRRDGGLEAGARVADVGSGHGASTIHMAEAYPKSKFSGSDHHEPSIETARERAAQGRRRRPEEVRGRAGDRIRGAGTTSSRVRLPARHGRPLGAARHARASRSRRTARG